MTAAVDLDVLLNIYTSLLAQGGNNLLTDPFRMTRGKEMTRGKIDTKGKIC